MTNLINLTPHAICLNSGENFQPSGTVARVSATFVEIEPINGHQRFSSVFGDITDLPEPTNNTVFIVSAIVLEAAKRAGRTDVVAPATGHPNCVRNDKGHIVSVPGFV